MKLSSLPPASLASSSPYGLSLSCFFALFGVVTLVFLLWPTLDLHIQRQLFDPVAKVFPGQQVAIFSWASEAVEYLVVVAVVVPGLVLLARWRGGRVSWLPGILRRLAGEMTGRMYGYLLLSLLLGPGLVVNELFKNHWGRARPRQLTEFGGAADFTPPWLPAQQCDRNCSFTSGDPSVLFWGVSLAFLLPAPWRGRVLWASVLLGLAVGMARMAVGAHFFSDVLYSGLFVYLVARCLHAWMLAPEYRLPGLRGIWPRRGIQGTATRRKVPV
jgi:lipid A 4'-phosphatase